MLPLFEHDLQSLKLGLRQHSLPIVQVATYKLPTGFFTCLEKGKPYVPIKSVLAAAFLWQRGKVFGNGSSGPTDQKTLPLLHTIRRQRYAGRLSDHPVESWVGDERYGRKDLLERLCTDGCLEVFWGLHCATLMKRNFACGSKLSWSWVERKPGARRRCSSASCHALRKRSSSPAGTSKGLMRMTSCIAWV